MDTPRLDTERATADLRFCYEQFESIRSDVRDLATALTAEQLVWQPNASSWSVAHCIEHLNIAIEHDLFRIAALGTLARAATVASRGPLTSGTAGATVITLHELPRQALATVATTNAGPPQTDAGTVVARFLALNSRLLESIESTAEIAHATRTSPTATILLDMVGHALQLNALHHWRFILQARRVKERPGFPRR
jgi:hypothetical protein